MQRLPVIVPGFAADDDFHIVAQPAAAGIHHHVLRTDVSGMPLEWIDYKEAARLYHQGQIAYTCGSPLYRLYGGTSALTFRACVVPSGSVTTIS